MECLKPCPMPLKFRYDLAAATKAATTTSEEYKTKMYCINWKWPLMIATSYLFRWKHHLILHLLGMGVGMTWDCQKDNIIHILHARKNILLPETPMRIVNCCRQMGTKNETDNSNVNTTNIIVWHCVYSTT
mmetsp:Transcript_33199/g.68238  ORF Transcript_33199/g.68238 Transcript_33199/m.68238 type:complete len:131 (-) Transcript_33199:81-473(-)